MIVSRSQTRTPCACPDSPTFACCQFATTPFKGPNRNGTFANVLKHEVTFPEHPAVSAYVLPLSLLLDRRRRLKAAYRSCSNCKSAIRKLLWKEENRRLGSQSGASEVKAHKWFGVINWGLLRNTTPPVSARVPG